MIWALVSVLVLAALNFMSVTTAEWVDNHTFSIVLYFVLLVAFMIYSLVKSSRMLDAIHHDAMASVKPHIARMEWLIKLREWLKSSEN